MTQGPEPRDERWAIILAGGEGARLRPLTRIVAGDERPKQFCRILGRETLLGQACRRVSRSVPRSRTLAVLTRSHERFYAPLLRDLPGVLPLVQPAGRGTAAAILYGLVRVEREAPGGYVVILPSDHYVSDDAVFMAQVDVAFEVVRARPELVVLLGVKPTGAETGYGWIEPTGPVALSGTTTVHGVRRFWEKPPRHLAEIFFARGLLWNSFVMVARVPALLSMTCAALPALFEAFAPLRSRRGEAGERSVVETLYGGLGAWDFSRGVLQHQVARLGVLPVGGVDWSDWGEPGRVLATLAYLGQRPGWVTAVRAGLG